MKYKEIRDALFFFGTNPNVYSEKECKHLTLHSNFIVNFTKILLAQIQTDPLEFIEIAYTWYSLYDST
jgi:hypothetical protein